MHKSLSLFLAIFFNGMLIFLLQFSLGSFPPLGKVLNPFKGVWQNYEKPLENTELTSLKSKVQVGFDEHGIPHVFAENDKDLYFVQGFLHAKHRLFQLDLQNRAGGGTLSELIGKQTLAYDQFFVRIGMREASERALQAMMADTQTKLAIESYVEGINYYIKNLEVKDYPPEYKLLNTEPKLFTPLRIAQFLKIMSYRLAGKSFDLELTRLREKFGKEKIEDLFPTFPQDLVPIVRGTELEKSLKNFIKKEAYPNAFKSIFADYPENLNLLAFPGGKGEGFNGSNNWAVDYKHSKTGRTLLANDTHLMYGLPNIWYEMQLTTPGVSTYGASFVGAPGIVLGFNSNISWGVTNATSNVMDFYQVEFNSEKLEEYKFKGEWRQTQIKEYTIEVRAGKNIQVKQLWTQWGPVVARQGNKALVLKWVAHQPSNELKAFYDLNRASNYEDCRNAIKYFTAPAQNFICADADQVSIIHNGKIPMKLERQGVYVMDGGRKVSDWQKYIDHEELPQSEPSGQPQRGFVFSANQHPHDSTYKHFLGWYYDDSYRASRIEQVLKGKKKFNWQDMINLQNDIRDKFAEQTTPYLLKNLKQEDLTKQQKEALQTLLKWNFNNEPTIVAPSLFYIWWRQVRNNIWQDQLWANGRPMMPLRSRTLALIRDLSEDQSISEQKNLFWIDDETTKEKETLGQLVSLSFHQMWQELSENFGNDYGNWLWQDVQPTEISHIAKIPGFSSGKLVMGGSNNTVNANTGLHGASWKMIVDVGGGRAWANMPGGVSGNPFSKSYNQFTESWAAGEMRSVNFWQSASEGEKVIEFRSKQ